jgi:hypothetical protein
MEASVQSPLLTEGWDEGTSEKKCYIRVLLEKVIAPVLPQSYWYLKIAWVGDQNLGFVTIFEPSTVTVFDTYPLPIFKGLPPPFMAPNILQSMTYIGFWQISIKEEHKELTGFLGPFRQLKFTRSKLPFKLSNSLWSF